MLTNVPPRHETVVPHLNTIITRTCESKPILEHHMYVGLPRFAGGTSDSRFSCLPAYTFAIAPHTAPQTHCVRLSPSPRAHAHASRTQPL